MNKKLKIFLALLVILLVGGIGAYFYFNQDEEKTYTINNDTLKFKEEYESLNGKDNGNGKNYLSVNIKSYNGVKYSSYEEIFDILDHGTGVIYFGFPECPWCRNLVPVLIDSAYESKIDTIYYLNIKEDRDVKELTKKGKIKTTKDGTENYNKLVKKLNTYLPVYTGLKDDTIKRVYLPSVVFVKNGKILGLEQSLTTYSKRVDGNPYIEMTSEEKEELTTIFNKYYEKLD